MSRYLSAFFLALIGILCIAGYAECSNNDSQRQIGNGKTNSKLSRSSSAENVRSPKISPPSSPRSSSPNVAAKVKPSDIGPEYMSLVVETESPTIGRWQIVQLIDVKPKPPKRSTRLFKAQSLLEPDKVAAIKFCDKTSTKCQNELEAYQRMKSSKIVELYGWKINANDMVMVMEWSPYGTVKDMLDNNAQKRLQLPFVQSCVKDILEALKYLHSLEPAIAHADVHPGNFFLFQEEKNHPHKVCKLADFDSSYAIESEGLNMLKLVDLEQLTQSIQELLTGKRCHEDEYPDPDLLPENAKDLKGVIERAWDHGNGIATAGELLQMIP